MPLSMTKPAALSAIFLLSIFISVDEWQTAQVREVFSSSRNYFVRVTPGDSWGDTVGFQGAKKGPYAKAEFYKLETDKSYKPVAEITLLNPVAPVEFFVSDNG